MAAIQGFNASISWAGYANAALSSEVLTDSGDHQTFNISSGSFATKRIWDRNAAFVVQTSTNGGGTWTTAGAGTYTIRYVTGQVFLSSALTGTPACQILSGAYLPINSAANAKLWEVVPTVNKLESTVFNGTPNTVVWKTYVPGIIDAAIKITQWWADSTWITVMNQTNGANLLVVELYTGRNTYERYSGFAHIVQDDVKVAVNALIEEPLDFISDGKLYAFSGQYS